MQPDLDDTDTVEYLRTALFTLAHDLAQPLNAIRIAAESILYFKTLGTPLSDRAVERSLHLVLAACEQGAERIEEGRQEARRA